MRYEKCCENVLCTLHFALWQFIFVCWMCMYLFVTLSPEPTHDPNLVHLLLSHQIRSRIRDQRNKSFLAFSADIVRGVNQTGCVIQYVKYFVLLGGWYYLHT